jgi:uncharacterized protein (TIGR01777 family)
MRGGVIPNRPASITLARMNPLSSSSPQRIAITGASGLVGRHLAAVLQKAGHTVWPVRRDAPVSTGAEESIDAQWNVQTGAIQFPDTPDVLVHLAGRSVAARWSERVKKEIWDSRVPATEKLCAFLAVQPAEKRPRLLISASAVGIYGNRGDEVLTEDSPLAEKGSSLLADIGLGWEAATRVASDAGIRVVHLRIGVVLSREGGALAKMLTPTKLFAGGPIGSGSQYWPWISLTDLSRLIVAIMEMPEPPPVINGVGPAPVRQQQFMRALGHVVHRPTFFPMPAFVVKLMLGQMGEEVLLSSMRVISARLPSGFTYQHETIDLALRAELGLPAE